MNCPVCGNSNPDGALSCRMCTSLLADDVTGGACGPGPDWQQAVAPTSAQQEVAQLPPVQQAAEPARPALGHGQTTGYGNPGQGFGQPDQGYGQPDQGNEVRVSAADVYSQGPGYEGQDPGYSPADARCRPLPVNVQTRSQSFSDFLPLLALMVGGAIALRLTAEILVRFYSGLMLNGANGGTVQITNLPNPLGLVFAGVMVLVIAVSVGWLAGKIFHGGGFLIGGMAALGMCVIEIILSLARIGAIGRIQQYTTGKPAFNWPYTAMLIILTVMTAGVASHGASGWGMERVGTASLKKTIIVFACFMGGALVVFAGMGMMIKKSRSYSAADVRKTFAYMESQRSWKGTISIIPADSEKRETVAEISYDGDYRVDMTRSAQGKKISHYSTADQQSFYSTDRRTSITESPTGADILNPARADTVTVKDHHACTWESKGGTVAEISGDVKDFPMLAEAARLSKDSPKLGDGTTFHGYVWTDVPYEELNCISVDLKDPNGKPAGRMHVEFTSIGARIPPVVNVWRP